MSFINVGVEVFGLIGEDQKTDIKIENALHFSVENTGSNPVKFGFKDSDISIELAANTGKEFPYIDPACMRYNLKLYAEFTGASSLQIIVLRDK